MAGVEKLQLGDNRRHAASGNAIEFDQRCVADQFGNVVGNLHDSAPDKDVEL
jgi:hypothetical protein